MGSPSPAGVLRLLPVGLAVALGAPASAQEFPAPSDRDYTIDLYQGAALGSVRIIGMGGTAMATAEGSAGAIANPASPAVRPATSHDTWDWDWHLDSLSPQLGSDFDNNGIVSDDASFAPAVTAGLVGQYKNWALAIVSNGLISRRTTAGNGTETSLLVTRFFLARSILRDQLVLGGGVRGGQLTVDVDAPMSDAGSIRVLDASGASLEAGVVWKPSDQSYRVGVKAGLPVASGKPVHKCELLEQGCEERVLPGRVVVPWEAALGFAARHAPTAWNRHVKDEWRDEPSLTWAVDVLWTGKVENGYGLEAFSQNQLQPSGRKHAVSVRGGLEYEWVPGRLRVRSGSYYEPTRFKDPSGRHIPGRLHLTIGFDVRVWSFELWNDPYRVRLSLTGDVAERYGNGGLSIGLWH